MKNLKKLMNPKSVAIIGASEKAGTVGNELVLRAIEANFNGKLVAVNPNYKTVCGLECFLNFTDLLKRMLEKNPNDRISIVEILVCFPSHSLTHSLIHSFTHSLNHSLTL